jgi:uncharacterized membrane protein
MTSTDSIEHFFVKLARESWQLFQSQALAFVLATGAASAVSMLSLGLLMGPLFVGLIDVVRRAARGESVQVGQVFDRFDSFATSSIALLFVGIGAAVGCVVLVVPGLLVSLFATFTLHAIAYERLSAVAAIKRSAGIVRDNFLQTLLLVLAISAAQAMGGAVVLGMLLTLPLCIIASTLAYARLAGTPSGSDGETHRVNAGPVVC